MKNLKRRKNGKGTVAFLGNNRSKPFAARITIGKDINGKPLYYDIDTFEEDIDALVCLENYHKEPYPLYIKEDKYNRIFTFPCRPYPLVAVQNPHKNIIEKVKQDNYTFKQLFEKFKTSKLPTQDEIKLEKAQHIKPKGKFAYHYSRGMITAFNNSKELYDKVYKDLRTSDFQEFLSGCNKNYETLRIMKNLYIKLDEFAFQEDLIEKSYAQYITLNNTDTSSNTKTRSKERTYTYEQIQYLWNIKPENYKEEFIKNILLLTIYTGCRAEELLFIKTENIFFDKNYFVGGIKTKAGTNREIPIHPDVKIIFEKYYNANNEFLFIMPNGNRANYDYYLYHYKENFIEKHSFLEHHTAHDGRHTLRTELEKLNVKQVIINSIIGHSNDNVGQDVYTHISIEEKQTSINLVTYKKNNNLYVLASY
jgi:integrase